MPAVRSLNIDGLLDVELEETDDLRGTHFTDETFEHTIAVTNRGDRPLSGTIEFVTETEASLGIDREPISRTPIELDLDSGETHRQTLAHVGMVGGSGIGITAGITRPDADTAEGHTVVSPGEPFLPLASFTIWDREFYRVNYTRPRQAQYLAAGFGLLSAIFALLIVLTAI